MRLSFPFIVRQLPGFHRHLGRCASCGFCQTRILRKSAISGSPRRTQGRRLGAIAAVRLQGRTPNIAHRILFRYSALLSPFSLLHPYSADRGDSTAIGIRSSHGDFHAPQQMTGPQNTQPDHYLPVKTASIFRAELLKPNRNPSAMLMERVIPSLIFPAPALPKVNFFSFSSLYISFKKPFSRRRASKPIIPDPNAAVSDQFGGRTDARSLISVGSPEKPPDFWP